MVSADISDPLSIIGISAKFHIVASLILVILQLSLTASTLMVNAALSYAEGEVICPDPSSSVGFIEGSGNQTSHTQAEHTDISPPQKTNTLLGIKPA